MEAGVGTVVEVVVVEDVVGGVALHTVSVTVWPVEAVTPAPGVCLITVPFCDELQLVDVVEDTVEKPAPVSVALAAPRDEPTTLGSDAWQGPVDTEIPTVVPLGTFAPARGVVEATTPRPNELEQTLDTFPGVSV